MPKRRVVKISQRDRRRSELSNAYVRAVPCTADSALKQIPDDNG